MQPVDHRSFDIANPPVDVIEVATGMLSQSGLATVPAVFAMLDRHAAADDAVEQEILVKALILIINALDAGRIGDVIDILPGVSPRRAAIARELLFAANFDDGDIDHDALNDAAALCLAALVAVTGEAGQAVAFLDEQTARRGGLDFNKAAFRLRAWALDVDATMPALWPTRLVDDFTDLSKLRRTARALAEADDAPGALAAFATALALPIDDDGKRPVVEDFATYAIHLRINGADAALSARHLTLALAANVPACRHAIERLAHAADVTRWRALPPSAIADVQDYLGAFVLQEERRGLSPFPQRGGKPHVDTVWLEITNHCNQKCTFCPDMHREDTRTWMPLDRVKRTIDQLVEGVSVGSMQLNAYGEPLLHPHIAEILAYIREKQLPWPTFFTSHGLTLVEKKLKQLSGNYPQGIAISLHNDGEESYALTRSAKVGDYDTLVTRVSSLFRQMVNERAPSHLRLYQMISNGREDQRVHADVRRAFPDTADRLLDHVRKWEAIGREIADQAPPSARAVPLVNDADMVRRMFDRTVNSHGNEMPILEWTDLHGRRQQAFMSTRPVDTYANLLLEYDGAWQVGRTLVNSGRCHFVAKPSLAIFASGRLGICCIDMNSTATFAALDDFPDVAAALNSAQAGTMFAELANGVATSTGCQICLSGDTRKCGS